jgi:RimJ/RimL family protein N-acetyltransferase
MEYKILTSETFLHYFMVNWQDTGINIRYDNNYGEYSFNIITFLPKNFFDINNNPMFIPPLIRHQFDYLPEKIKFNFELIGIGNIGEHEAFVLKPWVNAYDNPMHPMLYDFFEGIPLFVPSVLFRYLIECGIFLEIINIQTFGQIKILHDIDIKTFKRFGLDRNETLPSFYTNNLNIFRIELIDENEILKFYTNNWDSISEDLRKMYFQPLLNTWFRIYLKTQNKAIGFIRLYNRNRSFNGGFSLEYIIDKNYRNNGFATEASNGIIAYLKKYSHAISINAEVNENNIQSVNVLKKCGFTEHKSSSPFDRNNYHLSLLDSIKDIKKNNKISIQSQYMQQYYRYF